MKSSEAFLILNLLPKIGPVRVRALMKRFGSPERIFSASRPELQRVPGIGTEMAESIKDWENRIDLPEEYRRLAEHDVRLLTLEDDEYPKSLREIYDAPFLLYIRGKLLPQDAYGIAIVGSRRMTHYGREVSRRLSYQLAYRGVTIISGLARGIDTAAHEAAIAANGRTVAVLGSGLGNVYPAENQALADRIADGNGAVLSEYPVLAVPDKTTFPMRNRIVSGMSYGVLVAEAPVRSGSLITANLAAEHGRNIYAIPGNIDKPTSGGCNELIKNGARCVTDAGDILDDLELLVPRNLEFEFETPTTPAQPKAAPEPQPMGVDQLDELSMSVYEAVGVDDTSVDQIIEQSRLSTAEVSVALLKLEMKRLIKQRPGKRFIRNQ